MECIYVTKWFHFTFIKKFTATMQHLQINTFRAVSAVVSPPLLAA